MYARRREKKKKVQVLWVGRSLVQWKIKDCVWHGSCGDRWSQFKQTRMKLFLARSFNLTRSESGRAAFAGIMYFDFSFFSSLLFLHVSPVDFLPSLVLLRFGFFFSVFFFFLINAQNIDVCGNVTYFFFLIGLSWRKKMKCSKWVIHWYRLFFFFYSQME